MATQWGRIKAAYLKGGVSYAELARKYHLSAKTIQNRASKEGWRKEKGEIEEEIGKATRARVTREKLKELDMLIEANRSMAEALMKLAADVVENPERLMGAKNDAKAADSLSKAIETTVRTQRDLFKLPTLDQDMHKKEMAQKKREATVRMQLDRERFELEKEKRQQSTGSSGILWNIHMPEGEEELDG